MGAPSSRVPAPSISTTSNDIFVAYPVTTLNVPFTSNLSGSTDALLSC